MTIRQFGAIVLVSVLCACSADRNAISEADEVRLAVSARSGGTPTIEVIEPQDGATVTSPFRVRVSTDHVALAPAGRTLDGEGHWHVMVDGDCLEAGEVIPKDDSHLHVGSGEDHAEFDLAPGVHDLCVQLGDGFHVAVAVTDVVRVNVVDN